MKLLQVLYPGLGGTSTVAFSIVNDLKKNARSDVKNYFIFHGVENLTKNNRQICRKKKINFSFFLKTSQIFDTLKVYSKIKSINPDYILSHSNSFFALLLIKIFTKKKFYCVDHTPDEVRSFKEWINLFLFVFFSDGIVFVSEREKDSKIFLIIKLICKKIKIIKNGVNTVKFKRDNNILRSKKIKIGMAARFVNEKKQLLIVDTFIKNKNFFCNKNVQISFAGSGLLFNQLKKKVKENNLTRNIRFEGNLTENKLINWFNKIDIYFHLSEAETTSTAILQALSNSLPFL